MTLLLSFLLGIAAPADTVHLEQYLRISHSYDNELAEKNTRQINTVLKEKGGSGRVFKLPAGKIWINASIKVPSHTTLTGHEKGSEILINHAEGNYTEGIIVNENFSLGNATMDRGISLVNFTLNGNKVHKKDRPIRGVFFNKVSNVYIHKLRVTNTQDEGIRVDVNNLEAVSENIEISDCFVDRRDYKEANIIVRSIMNDGGNTAFWPSRVKHAVVKNNVSIGGVYGVCLSNVTDVQAFNNVCTANFWRGIIVSPTCSDVLVKKNTIDSAGSTGIHIAFYGHNITIDSNVVSNTQQDMSGKGYEGQGIKCYVGFSKLVITNNYSYNNATDGIAIEGGADGDGFLIAYNTVFKNNRNGIRILSGAFVINKGGNIKNGTIRNNEVRLNKNDGIAVLTEAPGYTVKRLSIKNNNVISANGKKKVHVDRTLKID